MKLSKWIRLGEKIYVGRKIVGIRYLSGEEAEECGFNRRPPVLVLDNGLEILPLQDDEANGGGALGQLFCLGEAVGKYPSSILPVVALDSEERSRIREMMETEEQTLNREEREDQFCEAGIKECLAEAVQESSPEDT